MAWFKHLLRRTIIALLIGVGFLLPLLLQEPAPSSSTANGLSLIGSIPNIWNLSPPPTGQPDNRQGAATRGDSCFFKEESGDSLTERQSGIDNYLTALAPRNGVLTREAYPSFFWYLPKTSAEMFQFILYDGVKDEELYSAKYSLKKEEDGYTAGDQIMRLDLPNSLNIVPLEVGKIYSWELNLHCQIAGDLTEEIIFNELEQQEDFFSESYIQRIEVAPEMASKLDQAKEPEELIPLLIQAGLLPETLTTLFELQRSQPDNPEVLAAWTKIIQSLDLRKTIDLASLKFQL